MSGNPEDATSSSRQVVVHLEGIYKSYQMGEVEVPVLNGIDLEIYAGEFAVFLGPSGSGKTTLVNIIGGMDSPTKGHVYYEGQDLSQKSESDLTQFRRNVVGFVFQHYNLVPTLTTYENIQVATEIATNPLDIDEVLAMVELTDRAKFFPSQMSGGQQQRVAIARGIAKNPKLLLCDEPTGALDYTTGVNVLRLLQKVNRELGMTILVITHNTAIGDMAHRVFKLNSGEITEVITNEDPASPEKISW